MRGSTLDAFARYIVLCYAVGACGTNETLPWFGGPGAKGESQTPVDCNNHPGPRLADEIAALNAQIGERQLLPLTDAIVRQWADQIEFRLSKQQRRWIREALGCNKLPTSGAFQISDRPGGLPPLITFLEETVIEGMQVHSFIDMNRTSCETTSCTEPFIAPSAGLPFPSSVPVRIEEVPVSGACWAPPCQNTGLQVTYELSEQNLGDLASYLSVGFGLDRILTQLNARLAAANQQPTWVSLKELFPNWIAQKVSTFPQGTFPNEDNDACFGSARQFYHEKNSNEGRHVRSAMPLVVLLHDSYRMLDDHEQPTFGDVVWIPYRHASRFVMTDPTSGRWIGFGVQTGGVHPYRFWWIDRDFGRGDPNPAIRQEVDIWRR